MKMITLEGARDSLRELRYEIALTEEVRAGARRALERMLELGAWQGFDRASNSS